MRSTALCGARAIYWTGAALPLRSQTDEAAGQNKNIGLQNIVMKFNRNLSTQQIKFRATSAGVLGKDQRNEHPWL